MTDEQWRKLDEEQAVADAIEATYKVPRFDPFVELDPSPTFIKEVIKQLKKQSYEQQRHIQYLKSIEFPTEGAETRLKKTISKIKSYQFRLASRQRLGSWQPELNPASIGEDQIRRAKEVPIESLYTGSLKRSGSNLVGLCPFHSEKSPSFYIYTNDNRYHCFGCGADGDSVDFVVSRDKVDFLTAVKLLQ